MERPKRKEGEWGEGPSLAISAMFCSEFAYVFRLSVSMRKVADEHSYCVLMYMNSYIFHNNFIYSFYCHIKYSILYSRRYHWPTHMELSNAHAGKLQKDRTKHTSVMINTQHGLWMMMMIAFITFKSSLVPLFEGL